MLNLTIVITKKRLLEFISPTIIPATFVIAVMIEKDSPNNSGIYCTVAANRLQIIVAPRAATKLEPSSRFI
jgi:hypothetical protein